MKRDFMKKSLVIVLGLLILGSLPVSAADIYAPNNFGVKQSSNNGDNYVEDVYQKYKQIVTWKKNYLLVYIPDDARSQFVWSQFKVWENVFGGAIIFEKITVDRNADITVHYENPYLGKKVGYTRLSFKDGEIRKADMFIYDDILTNPLKDFAVLHEIGHALGITNHSPNPADIMYATKTARQNGLSVRDKNTIKILYGPSMGQEAYIPKAAPEITSRSSDLQKADKLLENSQFDAAIQEYKRIAIGGLDTAEAYAGIATCYYAMGKSSEAYRYAKKAIALKPNDKEIVHMYLGMGMLTDHTKDVKKFLDKYTAENPDALSDYEIKSTLIQLQEISSDK